VCVFFTSIFVETLNTNKKEEEKENIGRKYGIEKTNIIIRRNWRNCCIILAIGNQSNRDVSEVAYPFVKLLDSNRFF